MADQQPNQNSPQNPAAAQSAVNQNMPQNPQPRPSSPAQSPIQTTPPNLPAATPAPASNPAPETPITTPPTAPSPAPNPIQTQNAGIQIPPNSTIEATGELMDNPHKINIFQLTKIVIISFLLITLILGGLIYGSKLRNTGITTIDRNEDQSITEEKENVQEIIIDQSGQESEPE